MSNKKVIHTIGFFNDKFRETIKGSTFHSELPGYAMGNTTDIEVVKQMLLGSANNRYMFKYTSQSINYVECHDNKTFYDKANHITDNLDTVKKQELLATAMVLLAQGVPFIHSGQEFFRTKQNVGNSYQSGDEINLLDWSRREAYNESVDLVQKIIHIRKQFPCFKLKSTSEMDRVIEIIELNSKSLMMHYNSKCNILVIFKPNTIVEIINIPDEYRLLLATSDNFETEETYQYILKDIGAYIFWKR